MAEKDDGALKEDVEGELRWDPGVDESRMTVAASDGVVTLSGTVESYKERTLAEELALRVRGVRAVVNGLDVDLRGVRPPSDAELAEAIVHVLRWHERVPDDVRVVVHDAWVTLRGEVDWQYQRRAAELALADLAGIRGITNEVIVRPRPGHPEAKSRIQAALARSALLQPSRITVTVNGDSAVLRGWIRSAFEREEAERLAWAAGMSAVDNRLRIWPGEPLEEATRRVVRAIETGGALPPEVGAGDALTAVLCPLSLRISGGQAQDFLDTLPPSVAQMLEPCVRHRPEQPERFGIEEYLRRVSDHLAVPATDARRIARAVFGALRDVVPRSEAEGVASQLPTDLRELWQPALSEAA